MVGAIQSDDDDAFKSTIEVRDVVKDSLVATFHGYAPAVDTDGSVLFLRLAPPEKDSAHADAEPSSHYVDIARWTRRGIKDLRRIELSDEGGPYGVSEVVPLPHGNYAYRVSDEHEYRYFDDASGKPFFPGLGHFIEDDSGHVSKEQNSLVVSRDGRMAAYTERSWNQLTYLVVVNLTTGQRIQTPFYGSFPVISGDRVLFVSDPSFVRGGENLSFRQIASYALYAYHPPSGSYCLIKRMSGPAVIEQ